MSILQILHVHNTEQSDIAVYQNLISLFLITTYQNFYFFVKKMILLSVADRNNAMGMLQADQS